MQKLLLLGGRGQMGQLFARWLAPHYDVLVLDREETPRRRELLRAADLVIVTVPLHDMVAVIDGLAGELRPDALLLDFASVKAGPLEAMLRVHGGAVTGLHPMFGPGVAELAGQTIVVCPGRMPEVAGPLLALFARLGARLVHCSAAEHDHMMTVVQAIRHFATFALGSFLATEGVDVTRSLEFASPVYRLEIDMVSRLLAQDPALYTDIMMATDERRAMIGRLAAHYAELAALVAGGERETLLGRFESARRRFAQEAERAMSESNAVIEVLSRRMAGK